MTHAPIINYAVIYGVLVTRGRFLKGNTNLRWFVLNVEGENHRFYTFIDVTLFPKGHPVLCLCKLFKVKRFSALMAVQAISLHDDRFIAKREQSLREAYSKSQSVDFDKLQRYISKL